MAATSLWLVPRAERAKPTGSRELRAAACLKADVLGAVKCCVRLSITIEQFLVIRGDLTAWDSSLGEALL